MVRDSRNEFKGNCHKEELKSLGAVFSRFRKLVCLGVNKPKLEAVKRISFDHPTQSYDPVRRGMLFRDDTSRADADAARGRVGRADSGSSCI